MAYIGTQPLAGQYRKLDDISSGFNGATTSFTTSVGGTNVTAGSPQQLLVSLGGVIQQPTTDYTVNTSTITFTSAPASGLSFFAVLMGDTLNTSVPADSSVTSVKLASSLSVGLAAGSASTPSLFFTGDTNTGIYSPGADQVAISTNGTGRLFVDSNGRIGVGTASPTATLHIAGTTGITQALTAGEDALKGLVNIGTVGTSGGSLVVRTAGVNANEASGLGIDGTYSHPVSTINIKAFSAASASYSSQITFQTQSNSASPAERMRIDSSGRLLVGTSSGSAQLQVHGQIAIGNGLSGADNNANGGGHVKTTAWSTSGTSHTFSIGSYSAANDNFSGLVVISGIEKNTSTNGKAATIIGVVNKRFGTGLVFTEISNTKNNMTTFSCSVSSNDLVVSTDSSCRVCITFIGGY